jgi:PIN domain nuclease of toxin-antitoxin system
MIFLDTCALVWWTLDPGKLSDIAFRACDKIIDTGACISYVSIWEIGIKIKKNRLEIGLSLEEYVRRLHLLGTLEIIPVDEYIRLETVALEWEHEDPADRTIVATAILRNIPIVTKDPIISNFYPYIIW